ncbi:lysogenic conversion protein [Proteus mirabilis]|uniref:lysogenic conversion protein n=1 Tax=Proteus mirabilis TaxID=584 RepID=UPI0022A15800|nr:lysogenic conversion protein [Proteus mirabilis]
MIEPLSWENWERVYLNKKNNKRASLERHGLRNLHTVASLDFIVLKIREEFSKKLGKEKVSINARSIWIDGTPQAKFKTKDGDSLNCELADLLFIIHEINVDNTTKNCRAVLLQGKCSEKHDLLPNGESTKKERKLLESIDRNEILTLYPGTRAYGHEIGQYKLGGGIVGLFDCARYLMMPKSKRWNYKTLSNVSPYVIGWPQKLSSKKLGITTNYMESIISGMIISKNIGKEVKLIDKNRVDKNCEWSTMVYDLLNCYHPICMRGYNRQRRVYSSSPHSEIFTFSESISLVSDNQTNVYDQGYNNISCRDDYECELFTNQLAGYGKPIISTIYVQIKDDADCIP